MDTTSDPTNEQSTVSPRDLRVSDDEREHVVEVLQKAIGQGLIDLDEFTERTDIAYAATTRGQLNVVLSDLPGLVHRDAPAGNRPAATGTQPGRPGERLELVGHYSTVSRDGRWLVPERLLVRNKYGSTKLDFTNAEFTTDVVYVELDAKWGSVQIVIPERAAIDVNAINEVKYGSLEDKTGTNGREGKPRIVLSGRVHGGTLTVRHPRRGPFGHRNRSPWGCC